VLVILVAGRTEGLSWEMAECARRVEPDRIIVLVRRDAQSYEAFRSQVAGSLRLPPYPSPGAARYHAGEFCGLVRFTADWKGTFVPFEKAAWVGEGHEMASRETSLKNRLRLALGRVRTADGRAISMPGRNWLKIGFVGWLILLALFALLFGYLGVTGRLD
jgi:hypothetical protein